MYQLQERTSHICKKLFHMLTQYSTSMHHVNTSIFVIALFLFFSTQAVVHTMRCQPRPPPRFLSSFPFQHADDCQFLLSRIPGTFFHELTPTPLSLSIPFLPRTYVSHKTCSLQITWQWAETASNVTTRLWEPGPPVLEAFSFVAPAGADLVRECIQNGWDGISMKTLRGIKVEIHLGGPGTHRAWKLRQETLKELLAGSLGFIGANSFDTWSWGVWEV